MTRMEPMLYKKVILGGDRESQRFITCLRRRQSPHTFARGAVKRLCMFNMMPKVTLEILEYCTGVTALAMWNQKARSYSERIQESIDALPLLRELSLDMSSMFFSTTPSFAKLDMVHRITRLEVLDGWILWTSTVGIEEMTRLTHLALDIHLWHTSVQHIRKILDHCSALEVVLLHAFCSQSEANNWLEARGICDIRIVWTDNSTWINWNIIGLDEESCDLWDYASEIIAWRRKNDGTYRYNIQD